MALFVGRFDNKIDKKGRVSVPKPFRDVLASEGFAGIYVFPSITGLAIAACGEARLRELIDRMDSDLAMFSADHDDLSTAILENAEALTFDPEGRVTLPQELLAEAGIETTARFVGRGRDFRIWEPAAHDIHRRRGLEKARANGPTLPPKGLGGKKDGTR